MKTAVIIDSTSAASKELLSHPDVYKVDLTVIWPDGSIGEDSGDEKVVSDFYTKLKNNKELPTTSQPNPGSYHELFQDLIEKGYERVVGLFLAAGISGTYQTAQLVSLDYEDEFESLMFDTNSTSYTIEYMANVVLELTEAGKSLAEIEEALVYARENSGFYVMVGDLNNLVKGGRLSATSAFVGGLLRVKPIITINDEGAVAMVDKIRTVRRVYSYWLDLIKKARAKYPKGLLVTLLHTGSTESIKSLEEEIKKFDPAIEIVYRPISPVIGTHVGPDSEGAVIQGKIENL